MPLNILVQAHLNYSYMDATIVQGLRNLGHFVCGVNDNRANYLMPYEQRKWDLFVQCLCGASLLKCDNSIGHPVPSIMIYGLDDHSKLPRELDAPFDHVFVRDYPPQWDATGLDGSRIHPINFGIEKRYYSEIVESARALRDRSIDVCFLGGLYPKRKNILDRLRDDFNDKNLLLGDRIFNDADEIWSKYTLPYCPHSTKYLRALADTKVCLSLTGAGPDCARHWEIMASGGIPLIQGMKEKVKLLDPEPMAIWFDDYEELRDQVEMFLTNPGVYQDFVDEAFQHNMKYHSTAARAKYVLETVGIG